MLSTLLEQISSAGCLDWLAILTSIAYVVLAARNNNWCWLFAGVSTAVWAYQSWFVYQLASDALLQVFYFVMAGVGLWQWGRGRRFEGEDKERGKDTELPIRRMTVREHMWTLIGSMAGGLLLGYFFSHTLVAAATYPDAVTTVFSVITTFLLIGRRLENWLYWIVIDVVYVWIYLGQGAALFALMMVINVGVASYGYINWRREVSTAPRELAEHLTD